MRRLLVLPLLLLAACGDTQEATNTTANTTDTTADTTVDTEGSAADTTVDTEGSAQADTTVAPRTLTLWDSARIIDWLTSLPDVDPTRIGATGVSLGGMQAWLLAAADPRLSAAAPLIGVQSFSYAAENDAWRARAGSQLAQMQRGQRVLVL